MSKRSAIILVLGTALVAAPAAARDGHGVQLAGDAHKHQRRHGRQGVWIDNDRGHAGAPHGGHRGAGHGHFSPRGQGGHHWGW